MFNFETIHQQLFQDFSERFLENNRMEGTRGIRGAVVHRWPKGGVPEFIIFGTNIGQRIDDDLEDFSEELALVQGALNQSGVEELLSANFPGDGYMVLVRAKEPPETELNPEYGLHEPTDAGQLRLNQMLRLLNCLAWKAWAISQGVESPGFVHTYDEDCFRRR